MSTLRFITPIRDGILLSRRGEVHRDLGGKTVCRHPIGRGHVVTVSNVQAVVFKLPLCHTCYPDQTTGRGRA